MGKIYNFYLSLAACIIMLLSTNANAQTFVAPFGSLPDPNIVYHKGWYYYSGTSGSGISLKKAETLEGLKHTPSVKVFSSANGGPCCDYWAPELHRLNNKWYIYYTAKYEGEGQRTYVIENSSDDPMSGTWLHKGKIYDSQNDFTAIDGTVLTTNGKNYFIWSGVAKASDGWRPQRLYIALMTDPWTLQPGRVLLSSPFYSWEKDGNVNEGPAIIKHNGKIFLTYSANGCDTPNYLIAMLYMTEGGNPMNAALWTKHDQPLFTKFPGRDVYGPGHHSFFKSPDGKEDWFVYHATPDALGACDMGRTTRAQKVNWDAKGFPSLGIADPTGAWLTAPSGEPLIPAGSVLPNGIYKIKPTSSSNKVLDVSGCSPMRGTNVAQWQDNGSDCQKWHIIATPDGYYSINAVKGGLALDVEDCSTANGTNVRMWTPSGGDCQKWIIEQVSSGIYRFKSKKSGKVLDIQFGGDNNGANLQIYDYLGNAQQHFKLERLDTYSAAAFESYNLPGYFIRHQDDGRGRIDKNISPQQDGQWRMVPGLAGKGISFQSVNSPESYLRHSNGQVSLQHHDGSVLFTEDATFYVRAGLADASKVSFESYNYPGNYIRHRNYLLYSESVTAGTGYKDATFTITDQVVAPVVSLTSPADNASYLAPVTVNLVAKATVPYGSIAKVEFYNGNTLIGTEYVSPYTYAWKNVAAGTYTITAKATDGKGMTSISAARKITVSNPVNQLPVVNLTAPTNNSSYIAPASISISATAKDNDGTIAKVEFFNGSVKLGEKTSAPYSYSWTGVAVGTYSITAKATDNKGATSTSAASTVIVSTTVNQLPVVSLTAPTNNSTYAAPASISISASASDNDGTIAKVEFFNGTAKLGEKISSPYSYSWTNVAAGTYSITAKATDNKGATSTSAARTVVVNAPVNSCSSLVSYKENGGYIAGSKVKNVNNRYECKPYPYSGWCNGAAWAYAPGTGSYWTDAWILLGSCSARTGNESANTNATQLVNFPNPFSTSTDIELNLTEAGEVFVNVYDKTGQLVKVISEGYLNVGDHRFAFEGSQLNPGMYIVQVKTDSGIIRQKMMKLE